MRKFSQIPVRTKYFLTVGSFTPDPPAVGANYDDAALAFVVYPGPIVENGALLEVPYASFTAGSLLKDLGRQVVIVDADGKHLAVYRQVQRVNGADTEGVGPAISPDGPYGTFYVKVWSADGSGVLVVRTG